MTNFVYKLFSRRNLTIVLLTIIGFFGFLFVLNYGLEKYNQSKQWQEIKKSAEMFQKAEKELYQQMMADTYGGKTPQETLGLFISAVEKGDYELAGKYFVNNNQAKWKNMLSEAENNNEFLVEIKKVQNNMNSGRYSDAQDWFRVEEPVSIEFARHPNGVWKINEI